MITIRRNGLYLTYQRYLGVPIMAASHDRKTAIIECGNHILRLHRERKLQAARVVDAAMERMRETTS